MKHEHLFDHLNTQESLADRKRLLHEFLVEQLDHYNQNPEEGEIIAYEIAGLLATDFAGSVGDNDLYLQVLELAGQLELPEEHRGGASWDQLTKLIRQL